ncbi:MAG: pyridoxamine 5'-phosphate oxidase family protein [Pseudomonadota bacterium]|nr:pyridoxamine 5'-phosphate oxidase family protein [Pseudomonadota bacterium]|tara:strand:- start:469 stop:894 length:426 start_codon:yes stop_codon:yes gene_type:complete
MGNPFRNEAHRDEFLAQPRLAILITNDAPGAPIGVPVWFEWTGTKVQMFAGKETPKINRIKRDARASVLVTNAVGEPEAWVAFDGLIDLNDDGGIELAARLVDQYWNMDDERLRSVLTSWQQAPDEFCLLTLRPEKIRTGQ